MTKKRSKRDEAESQRLLELLRCDYLRPVDHIYRELSVLPPTQEALAKSWRKFAGYKKECRRYVLFHGLSSPADSRFDSDYVFAADDASWEVQGPVDWEPFKAAPVWEWPTYAQAAALPPSYGPTVNFRLRVFRCDQSTPHNDYLESSIWLEGR